MSSASGAGEADRPLQGRTIVVTGCTHGIGRSTATLLARRGAEVIGLDRDVTGAPDGLAQVLGLDLADSAAVEHVVGRLPARVDGLCNVAGVPGTAGADAVRDVNYLGLRQLTGLVAQRMTAGGSIACAASIAGSGWRARTGELLELARTGSVAEGREWCEHHDVPEAAYGYFKQALVVWTKHAAAAFGRRGIRINCVSPGPVDTRILVDFRRSLGDAHVQRDIDRVGGAGSTDDVAAAFAFLMSDDSRWIRGCDLACDGGLAALRDVAAETVPEVAAAAAAVAGQ